MTHIEALKPCPFCGCSVEHLIVADPAGNPAHESWVLCNVCKASSGISSTIGKARDKWNTRAVIDTALKSGELYNKPDETLQSEGGNFTITSVPATG